MILLIRINWMYKKVMIEVYNVVELVFDNYIFVFLFIEVNE